MSNSNGTSVELIGSSEPVVRIRELARRIGRGDAKVLLTGESGVGKDIVARYLHAHSTRGSRPFVPVNCAGLSDTLLESELFGHVKGSFTGAYRDKIGRLQLAHRGTVFLDELGEMSLRMQALLLRFLQNGEIQPVGSEQASAHIDVRVIAATNRDLDRLVAQGDFREDLLYRIKVVHIKVPALRERPDDVRLLVEHAIARTGRAIRFHPDAMARLEAYAWPGNVRELQNVVEQVSWTVEEDEIRPEHLPEPLRVHRQPPRPAHGEVADVLFETLSSGRSSFWEEVYPRFLSRDLTRTDVRNLIRRALGSANGNYRELLPLLGVPQSDYKRLLNFLASHDCGVNRREARTLKRRPIAQ